MAKKLSGKKVSNYPPSRPGFPCIWGWFIDPYLRTATPVQVPKKLSAWHEAIQVDCLDVKRLSNQHLGHYIDVWVDDCGQLRNPPLATFSIEGNMLYGYGLIFEGDSSGDTLSVSFDANFLIQHLCLTFDPDWEKRQPDLAPYFHQLTRVIEWEKWHAPMKRDTVWTRPE